MLLSQDLERLLSLGAITPEEAMMLTEGVKDAEARARHLIASRSPARAKPAKSDKEPATPGKPLEPPADNANGSATSQSGTPAIEMTVKELLTVYDANTANADAQFRDKIIRVKGIVDRIEIEYTLGIFNVLLVDVSDGSAGRVRCVFRPGNSGALRRIRKGQPVTIQGKYVGSLVDFRLTDCTLVE